MRRCDERLPPKFAEKGAKAGMFTTEERTAEGVATKGSAINNPDPTTLRPDDFSHKQSIVVKLDEGLAVFSSCSHCGPNVVLTEAHQFMPNQPIRALIGGFTSTTPPMKKCAPLLAA